MINLKRLNNTDIVINCELIETIEATPDTVITFTNGHKLVVRQTVDEVIDKIIEYKRKIFNAYPPK